MMDKKYDAIMLDVHDIGKAAIFERSAHRPSRMRKPSPGKKGYL